MGKSVTRTSRKTRPIMAPLVLGIALFCCHCVLIPIDGCGLNPARSVAPALVAMFRKTKGDTKYWENIHIFVIGPLVGAAAAGIYIRTIRTAGYFSSGSTQESGLRRGSVFDTSELAAAQIDDEKADITTPG